MISDSPYRAGELVLTPLKGLLSGLLAAILMLVLTLAFQPISKLVLGDMLVRIGVAALPDSIGFEKDTLMMVGVVFHILLGLILGILYALSQQCVPSRGLFGVAIFYGFMLWLVSGLLVGWLFGESLRIMVHNWVWLLACLLYGSSLAVAAVWSESHRSRQDAIVAPRD